MAQHNRLQFVAQQLEIEIEDSSWDTARARISRDLSFQGSTISVEQKLLSERRQEAKNKQTHHWLLKSYKVSFLWLRPVVLHVRACCPNLLTRQKPQFQSKVSETIPVWFPMAVTQKVIVAVDKSKVSFSFVWPSSLASLEVYPFSRILPLSFKHTNRSRQATPCSWVVQASYGLCYLIISLCVGVSCRSVLGLGELWYWR